MGEQTAQAPRLTQQSVPSGWTHCLLSWLHLSRPVCKNTSYGCSKRKLLNCTHLGLGGKERERVIQKKKHTQGVG